MADSGLPCFGYKEPLKSLQQRFHMEMTDVEAARFMRDTVDDAYDKVCGLARVTIVTCAPQWTTGFYDLVQYLQQGIPK